MNYRIGNNLFEVQILNRTYFTLACLITGRTIAYRFPIPSLVVNAIINRIEDGESVITFGQMKVCLDDIKARDDKVIEAHHKWLSEVKDIDNDVFLMIVSSTLHEVEMIVNTFPDHPIKEEFERVGKLCIAYQFKHAEKLNVEMDGIASDVKQ